MWIPLPRNECGHLRKAQCSWHVRFCKGRDSSLSEICKTFFFLCDSKYFELILSSDVVWNFKTIL